MSTKTFIPVKLVLESVRDHELYNKHVETVVNGFICKEEVVAYREVIDQNEPNPNQTFVETMSGWEYCVNMPFIEFHSVMTGIDFKKAEL